MMQFHRQQSLFDSLRLAAEASDLSALGGGALEAARRALGASGALLFQFGPGGFQPLAGGLVDPLSQCPAESAATDVIHAAGRQWGVIPTPVVVNGWEGFDREQHRRSAAYADFYLPSEVEQIICIHLNELPFGARGLVGILMTRSLREEEFGSEDLEVARACAAVFRGTARRLALPRLRADDAGPEAAPAQPPPALVLADQGGRISFSSPEADALLQPLLRNGRALPPRLAEAMAAYRAFLIGDKSLPARQRVVLQRGPHLPPVSCDLLAVRSASGAVVVGAHLSETAAASPDRVAAAAARFRLTRAEAAVLAGLVEGRKNAAIAASLNVSLETVRTHVRHILGKLAVANRTEVAHLVLSGR